MRNARINGMRMGGISGINGTISRRLYRFLPAGGCACIPGRVRRMRRQLTSNGATPISGTTKETRQSCLMTMGTWSIAGAIDLPC